MPENPLKKLRLISYNESIGRQIPEGRSDWFLAEGCARHVAITLNPEVEIPDAIMQGDVVTKQHNISVMEQRNVTRLETGVDAYSYLLMVTCGLLNKRRGDMHAKGQVLENFQSYQSTDTLPAGVSHIMNHIFADCKTVHEVALSRLEPYSEEPAVSARKIMGMRKMDMRKGDDAEVLIIGDGDEITGNTFKALGKYCSKIHVTHPDAAMVDAAYKNIMYAQSMNKYPIAIDAQRPEQLTPDFLKKVSYIFVCGAMGENTEFERNLINNWKEHCSGETKLIHLRGVPLERGKTAGDWASLKGMDGFVDREMLDAKHANDVVANKVVFADAFNACRNCAYTRGQGDGSKRPVKSQLTKPPEEYAQLTSSQLMRILT